ncbi:Protein of uncharacterised function (DUF3272) [Streptococcus ferus]|uniref:Protein of uncharacterized function (DUF3272) n=2 Tax=Streptococcus ferus TaxID=1345 RepID=A0A2X3VEK3_9STRE|nr:Protein of uncharacterised function (DUF3272) [Streptococcus ferus]
MVLITVFETILLNNAILDGDFFLAGFWGFLLLRNLRKVYLISKFTKDVLASTKKKD